MFPSSFHGFSHVFSGARTVFGVIGPNGSHQGKMAPGRQRHHQGGNHGTFPSATTSDFDDFL